MGLMGTRRGREEDVGLAHASEVEGTTETHGVEPHDSLKTGDLRGLQSHSMSSSLWRAFNCVVTKTQKKFTKMCGAKHCDEECK